MPKKFPGQNFGAIKIPDQNFFQMAGQKDFLAKTIPGQNFSGPKTVWAKKFPGQKFAGSQKISGETKIRAK